MDILSEKHSNPSQEMLRFIISDDVVVHMCMMVEQSA
jgi:hypothetical protein